MAINNNFNISQQNYQLQLQNQVRTSGQNAASANVAQGHTNVSKQQTDSNKGVREESNLSEAARKALEKSDLEKAQQQGGAQNAGKAAGQAKAKEKEQTRDGGADIRGGGERRQHKAGDLTPTGDGKFILRGETKEQDTTITRQQAQRLGHLDSKEHAEELLRDMPEFVRKASENMIVEKTDNEKKRRKHAKFKDGSKEFEEEVGGMELDLAESVEEAGSRPVPIQNPKQEAAMVAEDPFSEELVKEQAAQQLAEGGAPDEAFVAGS